MLFKRKRTLVNDIFTGSNKFLEEELIVCGWVQTVRKQTDLIFVSINDGSSADKLQIVISSEHYADDISNIINKLNTGCSIKVIGKLICSPAKGQEFELQAHTCIILGTVDAESNPLPKTALNAEYLRKIPHMRIRRQSVSSIARIRDSASYYTHLFFRNNHFKNINTPLITSGDCEGSGEQFVVTTLLKNKITEIPVKNNDEIDYDKDFFKGKVGLTVSGQLHAETYASGLGDIYTFGPTFRAENSNTSRHLAEFWMLEIESAFMDLQELMDISEDYIKYVIDKIINENSNDLQFLQDIKDTGRENLITNLKHTLDSDFVRISYSEVISILEEDIQTYKVLVKENYPNITDKEWRKKSKSHKTFEFKPYWGCDLSSEHERYICEYKFKKPCIVYNYPKDIKAFYMKLNPDGKTVQAMDILVPGIGELIGGSVREPDYDNLIKRMNEIGICDKSLNWYLDLRKYGSAHSAGFGLGFERLLMYLTGTNNIRDCISYPRFPDSIFG